MNVEVREAGIEEKPVLARLLQLYLYDFSEYTGDDVSEHGEYSYRYLDHYWAPDHGEERFPFLIRAKGKLAGFALVRYHSGHYSMAEFFVLRKCRRHGVGREAALALFHRFTGVWQVAELEPNLPAQAFWRQVIGDASAGKYEEERVEGAVVQRFVSA